MGGPEACGAELAARALAWSHRVQERVCDRIEPWKHGTVYRSARYPRYFTANLVVVRDDPELRVDELIAVTDTALAGLAHRRIDFDRAPAAEPLRDEFATRGFQSTRLVWMHFDGPPPAAPDVLVTELPYDAAEPLRAAWHHEDFPGQDATEFHAQAREIALALGTRVLAVHESARPVGFAALNIARDDIEIGAVYVLPEYRGQGRGTALTQAAIRAAGDVAHLWICADDEDRPKDLYGRLGFRPVTRTTELWRAA
jgi:GNAT superfamily N-acetyltransferase